MPITNSAQNWTPGETVKIGFLELKVLLLIPTPGDHRPDQYLLESPKGKIFLFTPHHGLEKIHTPATPPAEPRF